VLCLAFPLHPPGKPDVSRAGELRRPVEAGIPLHVVQGERDPFGGPDEVRAELPDPAWVTAAAGTHSFGRSPSDVVEAARRFLLATG
jgi:predicted alpha/beta-hydrolase family hydrolase